MAQQIVITNGTLIDGLGGAPQPSMSVLIEDGRFTAVARSGELSVPEGAEVVDAAGKWILPGLINGNVHLLDGIMMMGVGGVEYLARFEGELHKVIEESAQVALKNGVTTVFDTWDALRPVLKARDRIAAGEAQGARIFCGGNIVGMGGPFQADFMMKAREIMSNTFANRMDELFEANVGRRLSTLPPEEVRAIMRDYISHGTDFVKVAISDHLLGLLGFRNPYFTFSPRVLQVIVDEVRAAGIPLVTHTTSIESLNTAVEHDADVMIHATMTGQVPIPEETIQKIVNKGLWSEVQPSTRAQQSYQDRTNHPFADFAGGIHHDNDVRMIQAKAPLIVGTDAGCTDPDVLNDLSAEELYERPFTLGDDHVNWLIAMTEKGMDNMDAILANTSNVAKAYRKIDDYGTVEVGKVADVVLLEADPLVDIKNMRQVSTVIQGGRIVDTEALPVDPKVTKERLYDNI